MKKILIFTVLLSFAVACNNISDGPAVVSGKWARGKKKKLILFGLQNGGLKELASSAVNAADSSFYFAINPAKGGLYFIGTGRQPMNRFAFYIASGDRLSFTVTDNSYKLTGSANSPENIELQKWHDFVQPMEWMAVYFSKSHALHTEFFPLLQAKQDTLNSHYPKTATANKEFNRIFESYRNIEFLTLAVNFIFAPRTVQPEAKDFPDYYRNLNLAELTRTTDLTTYPAGIDLIDKIVYIKSRMESEKSTSPISEIYNNLKKYIINDTLKGEWLLKYATAQKSFEGVVQCEEEHGKYLVTAYQKNRFRDIKNSLNVVAKGAPALNFKFADVNGNQIALSDFKDKVVYIDIWATWCGPCKQELPHLKKLEEEFHSNKDLVFLGVGVDASKDIQKWKDYIAKENLKGVQIFAGDAAQKSIIEPYKISGIPRFILVGKDGNIVMPDAPRPSSQEIKPLLKSLLK